MEYNTYKKAVELHTELAELQTMHNSIPYPDKDTTDTILVRSPKLKKWLKENIEVKIKVLQNEFREL